MNYRIGDVDIEHRRNFFSASPAVDNNKRQEPDRRVDARYAHENWEYNVLNRRKNANLTYTDSFGDKITLSRLAVNMAKKAEQKTEG